MLAKPEAAQWLDQLIGEWSFEAEASMGPDQPPHKFAGKEVVRSFGGLWVLCEGQGQIPNGAQSSSLMTLGYDPAKRRYVGTFASSVMPMLWIYRRRSRCIGQAAGPGYRRAQFHRRFQTGSVQRCR